MLTNFQTREVEYGSVNYEACVELRNEVLREPLGLAFTKEEQEADRSAFHLAGEIEGEIVACLILTPVNREEIKMRQVAVSSLHRGLGAGRRLSIFAEEFAARMGYSKMKLHARESAVGFYEKLGYERVGERFEEVSLPHWEMVKRL